MNRLEIEKDMGVEIIAIFVLGLFLLAFWIYGGIISRLFGLDDSQPTPAIRLNDGVDYIPTKPPVLLGQHFAAISAAGPIVGPITAGIWFGWGPALLWIVLGAIFIGAFHDFSSLVASVRHHARSVAEIVKEQVGQRAYLLFLFFIWLSIIYIIIAFTDLTARYFLEPKVGGAVASSSFMYLLLATAMGLALYRFKAPLWLATSLGVPLLLLIIWGGQYLPIRLPGNLNQGITWDLIILGYCFIASVVPMWILLQPRGYLGGFFLYVALLGGVAGILFGGFEIQYPIFVSFTNPIGQPLFPIMFVTIACGACSGFHGLVSSGTTSKQISKESHSKLVGYGGMLLEGVVALMALITVMVLSPQAVQGKDPGLIYAEGLGKFISVLGIDLQFAISFGMLAFATFIFDTLDVATRLGRYIFQEFTGWQKGRVARYGSTLATLLIPLAYIFLTNMFGSSQVPVWKSIWPVFGSSNQLLAALTLTGVTIWLWKTKRKAFWLTLFPTLFMLAVTLSALVFMANQGIQKWIQFRSLDLNGLLAGGLLLLAIAILTEVGRSFRGRGIPRVEHEDAP